MNRVKLGKIADIKLGKMLHKKKNKGELKPYLGNINIRWGSFNLSDVSLMRFAEKELERYSLKYGDLILCEGGEPGRCAIWEDQIPDVKYQKALHRIRSKNGLLYNKYLMYWIYYLNDNNLLEKHFTGSTIKHLPLEALKEIDILLPTISKQQRIGDFLYLVDRKIALNNAINAELEKMARTLYEYWFVQFDFPNAEGKPYKSSGGEMVWSDELKREIPKGWRVDKLSKSSLCSVIRSGIDDFNGEKIYLSTSEVSGNRIINHTIKTSCANRLSRANMQPRLNSVWFAKMKDTVKNILVNQGAEILATDYIFSTGFAGLQCTQNTLYYVWNYLLGDYFETKKNLVATGATQQAINDSDLKGFDILCPPTTLLEKFEKTVSPSYHLISKTTCECNELTNLRDFLLPLLMNGQVCVATIETEAEVATEVKIKPVAAKEPSKRDTIFKRLVVSAYILDNICDEPTSGRVKFEKLLYLSEHCAQLPLHSEFQRAAAGPYDSKSLYSIESQLNKNKWFERQKIDGESRAYTRLDKIDGYKQYVGTNLTAAQKTVIDKLIALFKTSRTIQCEIVATLYGAWNDFLLEGVQPTEDQIVNEVLTNWHEKKERISRNRWFKALEWMKNEGVIPVGYGVSTKGGSR